MFNKKVVPDFNPRISVSTTAVVYAASPSQEARIPERILISESQKAPIVAPPPFPTPRQDPVPQRVPSLAPAPATVKMPTPTLFRDTLPQQLPPTPAANFSPSLETFTGTGQSYFQLASASSGVANWWQYPAGGPIDLSGNDINMIGGNILNAGNVVASQATIQIGSISSLTSQMLHASSIQTDAIITSTLSSYQLASILGNISTIDSQYIEASSAYVSSLGANTITLDNAVLTTAGGTELLLNGVPIATTANISSLQDWSFDPAVSTLNMNGNPIIGATDIAVSSINGASLSTFSAAGWSYYPAAQDVNMNSHNLNAANQVNLNTGGNSCMLTAGAGNNLYVNGTPLPTAGAASWANYPAISTVQIPDQNFQITNAAGGLGTYYTADINANLNVGNIQNAPARPTFNAYVDYFNVGSIVSPTLGVTFQSLGGVNINSLVGVSLAGGGGIAITGVGGINLQGGGAINVASGGILVSGGGIAVTAGGVAINGGGLQIGGGGIAVTGGDVRFAKASTIMGTPTDPGGPLVVYGNNVIIKPSGTTNAALLTDFIGTQSYQQNMQITNVSTINGIQFPPPIPGLNPNITLSTLVAANYVSTPQTYTNNITGNGVIIGSNAGYGITVGTGATEVNVTTDMFVDLPNTLNAGHIANVSSINAAGAVLNIAGGSVGVVMNSDVRIQDPHILYPEYIQECVTAGIDQVVNVSSINGIVGSVGIIDKIYANGRSFGTGGQVLSISDGAIIWQDLTNLGVSAVNALTGAITLAGSTGISVGTTGSTITITNTSPAVPIVAFSYNLYVSNVSGSDTIGTGTIVNPYKTIGKAMTIANAISDVNQVIITLATGTYTENVSMTRDNIYLIGGSTSLSTATVINGTITIDMTGTSQTVIIGGFSSLQITNIVYNNAMARNQSFIVKDCLIVPGAGVSGIVATDTSVGGNGDMTIQNCMIYMNDTIAVSCSNVSLNFVNTQITNNPTVISPVSMIQTTGTGRISLFGCSVIQNSTVSTVAPLVNLANTATTGIITVSNSILQYTSATADTGTGAKCCIRIANSAAISSVSVYNNLLICEGARTTNGSAGQYLAIQRTGAGTITLNYGQNICGSTANHLPGTSAGLTKTPYVTLGN
jgi:hypothetical protein